VKRKITFTFEIKDNCRPDFSESLLNQIDERLQERGALLHATTLEIIMDEITDYLIKNGKAQRGKV
jgi:hypothetical protein